MLPERFKFHFQNNLGTDMDLNTNSANEVVTLKYRLWKRNSSGGIDWSTEVTKTYTAADVADGGGAEFAEEDNSTNKYEGLVGFFHYDTDDGTADGNVELFYEFPTDTSSYPSDEADFIRDEDLIPIVSVGIVGADHRSVNFEL